SSVVLHIGGSESQRFRGALSLVQAWDTARNSTEVSTVLNAKETAITSPSYTRGLTADWGWDSFQPGPGITRMSSSKRGQTNKKSDKLPPTVTCPAQDVAEVAEGRLTKGTSSQLESPLSSTAHQMLQATTLCVISTSSFA
ncbi:hypothetical protein LSAT2_019428, partial [Lamellibrachia satsuma]